ncbi:hypothetical protein [Bradyrhizobium sp. NAS96.2]|uniref:hypothetical protein n=1 Tax=Bradyrhizobium sp. NAS96.2 TaxID=1680160 RepID=UPI00093D4FF6|nr:hypothetical protein [Bradyrhizobium sp. NAS96.2]OKO83268.1 hypothetical protein AC628_02335 [Bradyrhizobium sp. NAS96.2]
MSSSKPKLSLPKGVRALDYDEPFDVAVFDLLLPCRTFEVKHKVTESGRVSMTAEFLLRLLRASDGFDETDFELFFGFDAAERSFVLREAEEAGYVEREDGKLWLTEVGRGLFKEGEDEPVIYEVEQRVVRAGFDLLSFAPAVMESFSKFDQWLPELKVAETARAAAAKDTVRDKFRRFYGEFSSRTRNNPQKRRFLYSVDHVEPGNRFSNVVRVVVKSTLRQPSTIEPDLSDWKVGYEIEDRGEVVDSCASFLTGLSRDRHPGDMSGLNLLSEVAPEFMASFARGGALSPSLLLRRGVGSGSGTEASAAPAFTDAIAGSLFTNANFLKITDALKNAADLRKSRPSSCLWLLPQTAAWGATRALPAILDRISDRLALPDPENKVEEPPRTIAFVAGRPAKLVAEAFDLVISGHDVAGIPPGLEILLVPGLVAAICVHLPIEATRAFPTPVGLISFDDHVVERVRSVLEECSRSFTVAGNGMNLTELRSMIERSLD